MPRLYDKKPFDMAHLRATAGRCKNWGKWGPDDEAGTLNYITPEDVVAAAGLIRTSYGPFQLGELKTGEVEELKRKVVRDQLGLEIADTTGTAIKKKPARIIKRKARKPGEPGPGRPGLPKEPGDKTATGKTIPGKPKPGYGKSKPARPASDPAPRKFGTRVKSIRKP